MTIDDIQGLKRELALLYRVARVVHSLEISEVLQEIVSVVSEITGADSIFIYIRNRKTNELVLRASKNPHPDLLEKISMKVGEGITGWVARQKKPVAIPSGAFQDQRFKYFSSLPEDRFEAFLSVPITGKHMVTGVINAQHRHAHQHTETEINLLTAVGKLVGGSVENAQLIEETLELKEMLDIRKIVEKAKGILMKNRKISEQEAFRLLQKQSMNMRKSVKEIAEAIIIAQNM